MGEIGVSQTRVISFAGIIQGQNSSVRVTNDNLIYAVDLTMAVMNTERDYAGQVLRNLDSDVFNKKWFKSQQLSARGGSKTKLLTFKDAIQLVMVLPGVTAKEIRSQFAEIIQGYFEGDLGVHNEINADSASLSSALPCQDMEDRHAFRPMKKKKLSSHEEFENFIKAAFNYQKEAIVLRAKNEAFLIENGDDIDPNEEADLTEPIARENEELRESNKKWEEHIEELGIELSMSKSKLHKSKIKLLELKNRVRILSNPANR
jgi:hypothetical protein